MQTKHFYEFGPFRLDPEERLLSRESKPVPLPPKVIETLLALVENRGHLVDKDALMKRVWPDAFVEEGNLNKNVFLLRKTLGQWDGGLEYIETIPKRGYRFTAPVNQIAGDDVESPALVTIDRARQEARVAAPRSSHLKRTVTLAGLGLAALIGAFALWRTWQIRSVSAMRSLAVLPLENLSGDTTQDYFADGMTDELITDLGQIGSIRVISRTSIMKYKGVHKPLPQIARELDVDGIVEGTVLRSGDRVRVSVQLIQARMDKHLWAESYQGDLRDVLSLQNEVAGTIANQIRMKLTPEQQAVFKHPRAVDPEAHEAYLRGISQAGTIDGLSQSMAYFEQAIAKDPNYPEAHTQLADAYLDLGHMAALPPQDAFPRARTEALKALAADDSLADAHGLVASVKFLYDWDFPGAEKEFQRAIALNPNSTLARAGYSDFLNAMGRADEAIAQRARNQQIDPLSLSAIEGVGFQEYWAGRYAPSIEKARRVLAVNPNSFTAHLGLGLCLEQKHQFPEAIAELQKAADQSNDKLWTVFVAHAKAISGDRAGALKILADLQELSRHTYVSP